ncbi:GtrA family protein [Cohnella lubricantis]|uniref:GtrA family protein n=2 Tax=Cohnella lubricantis TaxID=2163172 RepID=A0A841TE96_9BACL|nr:GtrA family protein [Cohnella lubricantis]
MNTGVDFAVFAALVYGLHVAAIAAQPVSYLCGFANSYYWNRKWTFRSGKRANAMELIRFGVVNAVSFGVATIVLMAIVSGLGWSALIGKAASIFASLAVNYIGSRLWVFRSAVEGGEGT